MRGGTIAVAAVLGAALLLRGGSAGAQSRVRVGVDAHAGAGLSGGIKGSVLGAALRVGWQADRHLAVYGQGEIFGWSGTITADGVTAKDGLGVHLIALFSYAPIVPLELALGPSLDAATNISTSSILLARHGGQRDVPITYSGTHFGFQEQVLYRLVFAHEGDRRSGLSLIAAVHSMTGSRRLATTVTGGLGYEWF